MRSSCDTNRAMELAKQTSDTPRHDPIAALGMVAARAAQSGESSVWPHRALVMSRETQRESQPSLRLSRHAMGQMRHSDISAASPMQADNSSPLRVRLSLTPTDHLEQPIGFGMCSPSHSASQTRHTDTHGEMSSPVALNSPSRSINMDAKVDMSSPAWARRPRTVALSSMWEANEAANFTHGARRSHAPVGDEGVVSAQAQAIGVVAPAEISALALACPRLSVDIPSRVQTLAAAKVQETSMSPVRSSSATRNSQGAPLGSPASRNHTVRGSCDESPLPQSPTWLFAACRSFLANVVEVPVEVCDTPALKEDLKYTPAVLMATIENLQGTVAELQAKCKDLERSREETQACNADNEKVVLDLQQVRTELESRLQTNGLQFLNTIQSLEETNKTLTDKLQRLEQKRQRCDETLTESLQDSSPAGTLARKQEWDSIVQDFEVFQVEKEKEIQLVRIDANGLRRQLVKQQVDFCQRLAEAEQERDNVMHVMTEESEELQARIAQLKQDNGNLACKRAVFDNASSTASATSSPGSGHISSGVSEAPSICDCGISATGDAIVAQMHRSLSPAPAISGHFTPVLSGCFVSDCQGSVSDYFEDSKADSKVGILQCQVEISRRKQKLTDMENMMLKNQIEALRKSLTPDAEQVDEMHA